MRAPSFHSLLFCLALGGFFACSARAQMDTPAHSHPPGYRVGSPQIEARGATFKVTATASAPLPCSKLWDVFTDFEAMPLFLPGLGSSKIVKKTDKLLLVEQSGTARYGPFSRAYRSLREVRLEPYRRVSSATVKTSEQADSAEPDVASQTLFAESGSGSTTTCVATYSVEALSKSWIPLSVATTAASSIARENMAAMLVELARRNLPA